MKLQLFVTVLWLTSNLRLLTGQHTNNYSHGDSDSVSPSQLYLSLWCLVASVFDAPGLHDCVRQKRRMELCSLLAGGADRPAFVFLQRSCSTSAWWTRAMALAADGVHPSEPVCVLQVCRRAASPEEEQTESHHQRLQVRRP